MNADLARDTRAYLEDQLDVVDVSELGLAVARVLDDIWGLDNVRRFSSLRTANWRHQTMIELAVGARLSSYDNDHLTQLVVRCHDACVRIEVHALNARQLRLTFSRRERAGGRHERHPVLADAVAKIRRTSFYGLAGAQSEVEGVPV